MAGNVRIAAMPTDGADFQRRRPLYGRFFVDIKQGASDDRLVTSGCLGIAREITKDRQMPMFRPMVEALVAIRPGENLFAQDTESYESAVSTAIAAMAEQFPPCEAVRDLERLMSRAVLRLAGRTDLDECNYREALFSEVGLDLFAEKVIDPAGEALIVHRGLSPEELGDYKQSLCKAAQAQMAEMLRSVYENPRGVPARLFLQPPATGPVIDSLSSESLGEPLAPL
jgi:hypothetical protein